MPLPVLATWRNLEPGIEYLHLPYQFLSPWSHIHALRINLNYNFFSIVTASELLQLSAAVTEYTEKTAALIAVNGGFFDHNYKPLGLRITARHKKIPLKSISWWGVFYIEHNRPHVISMKAFQNNNQIDFAIQSGPRLLIKQQIPELKSGIAERSALGITKDNKIIIVVTENAPLSTTKLAEIMRASPLNCQDAINLDGGGSSQLNVQINHFNLHVPGFNNVSDAIIIKARPTGSLNQTFRT